MLKKCTEGGTSENAKKLLETKEEASNDMILLVKLVFPVVIDLQMECLPLVGLPSTKDGKIWWPNVEIFVNFKITH